MSNSEATAENALAAVREAFRDIARPEQFIRGTCRCCECVEHNETLASHTPDTIGPAQLALPAWDPICAANDQAFAYYMPAMVRIAFEDPYYIDQLLFHLNIPDRVDVWNRRQAAAVLDALWTFAAVYEDHLNESDLHRLGEAAGRLELVIAAGDPR